MLRSSKRSRSSSRDPAHIRALLKAAQAGDDDAVAVLIDALELAGESRLAEDLALALRRRAAYETFVPDYVVRSRTGTTRGGLHLHRGDPLPEWMPSDRNRVLQQIASQVGNE